MNYYNEFDPFAAAWLRELIKAKLIPDGDVDERSITEVQPSDLILYTQCHFFAGIGGWSYALQLAGWPADRPVWTGSCPCQPFSTAGNRKGKIDERHLWPVWLNLITKCRPPTIFGEQVSSAVAHGWLDDVYQGLEAEGYACGSAVLPACSVGAPHKRDRLWFVAHAESERSGGAIGTSGETSRRSTTRNGVQSGRAGDGRCVLAQSQSSRRGEGVENTARDYARNGAQRPEQNGGRPSYGRSDGNVADPIGFGQSGSRELGQPISSAQIGDRQADWPDADSARHWQNGIWINCPDGKQRLVEPSIPLLAHGVPNRVGKLRGYGNAIVPQVAAEFIGAFMETQI